MELLIGHHPTTVAIGYSRRYKGVSFMSSLTRRCLRAVPHQLTSSLFRIIDSKLTAGLSFRCVHSGCATRDKLSEAVTSSDMANTMWWIDESVPDTTSVLAANVNVPLKPLRNGMGLVKNHQMLAEELTAMFATNRNARRPKKVSSPFSMVGKSKIGFGKI